MLATAGVIIPGLDDDSASSPPSSSTLAPASDPSVSDLEEAERAGISDVLRALESGEPLPYSEDGGTFQNREGLLPQQPIGYYREYTVETPGSPDRGARRLVVGEAGETYYTADHYASFTRIDPGDFSP